MNDALHNKVVKWFYDHEELLIAIMNKTPYQSDGWDYEIEVVKEFLTQTEQESVALQMDVIVVNLVREGINKHRARELAEHFIKHTTPPQRKEPEQEPSALYTKTKIEIGCSECGIGGGHALYCVRCAEKFVGGYKENVPVHASELLTQVSTDTQYAGNGTAGIQNETKSTGFFFQMPPQRTWVGLTDEEIEEGESKGELGHGFIQGALWAEDKLKEKNT